MKIVQFENKFTLKLNKQKKNNLNLYVSDIHKISKKRTENEKK